MLKRLWILALTIILAACSTSTPTPSHYEGVNLAPLVPQRSDLPPGLDFGPARDMPNMYATLPNPSNLAFVTLARNGQLAGYVGVFLYDNRQDVERAYNQMIGDFATSQAPVQGVGEKATGAVSATKLTQETLNLAELAFVRCGALAHVRMEGLTSLDAVTRYAKGLDQRITPLVCP